MNEQHESDRLPGLLKRLWLRMVGSGGQPVDRDFSNRSRLLSKLLGLLVGLVVLWVLVLRCYLMPQFGWANPEILLSGVVLLGILLACWLNRRQFYLPSAVLSVGLLLASVFGTGHLTFSGFMEPLFGRNDVDILTYLVLPVVIGSVLLPAGWLFAVFGCALGGVLLVPLLYPHIHWSTVLYGPGMYVVAVSSLLLLVSYLLNRQYRRSYAELQQREEQYRSLFEQSPDAVFLVAEDGVIEMVNGAGLALFGCEAGELQGRQVLELYVNPDDRPAVAADSVRLSGFRDEPVRMRRKDGSVMECLVTVWLRKDIAGCVTGYQTIIRDVTERMRGEEELNLRGQLLDVANDVVLLVDPGGEIVYANEATAVLTGYPATALVGRNIRELNAPEDAEQVPSRIGAMLRQGYLEFEAEWVCSDGRRVDVEVRSRTIQSRGRTLFLSVARDVSRRRADEAELRLRGELLDAAQDSVFLHDLKGRLVYANASAGNLLGYTADELMCLDARSLEAPEDASRFRERMSALFARKSLVYEANHVGKKGVVLPVEVRARLIESGGATYILSIARDIRERKRVEAALRESEEKFRTLFEQSMEPIATCRPDGRAVEANQAWLNLFGYAREELAGLNFGDLYVDLAERDGFLRTVDATGFVRDEVSFKRKDGTEFVCQRSAVARTDDHGNVLQFQGVFHDVTLQRQAERALRDSEEKYRSLFERSIDAVCVVAADGTLLEANRAYLELYGYDVEEIGRLNVREHYLDPGDREEFLRRLEKDGAVVDHEVQLRRRDGTVMDCMRTSVAHRDKDGRLASIQTVTRDITEQKRAEQQLRESEEKHRSLFEQSIAPISLVSPGGHVLEANAAWFELFGYSVEDLQELNVRDQYADPAQRTRFLALIRDRGSLVDDEVVLKRKDGTALTILRSVTVRRGADGEIVGFQNVFRDVTEQKRAERTLRESEEKYRSLFEQSMDAVAVYAVDGTLLDANPAHLRLFGLTSDDIGRRGVLSLYVNLADRDEFLKTLERDGLVVDQEVRLKTGNGAEIDCVRSAVARRDSDGRLVAAQTVTRDITARKRAEQELRESELRFRALVEHTGLGMAISRTDGAMLDCNDVFAEMLGYSKDEVLRLCVPDIYANLSDRERVLVQALRDGYVRDEVVEFRRKDRSLLIVSMTSALVPMAGETVVVSQFLDITGRKAAEREVLLSREELRRSSEQLHELTTYLEEARENERTGIARELHDQLGQALTALRMDVDGLRHAAASGEGLSTIRLDRMAALLDDTVNDVRRISSELRPGILDDLGLLAAVDWQLDQFRARSGIDCRLESRADDSTLDRPRCTAMFRVFQELLTNVVRHASAAHVWVEFDRDDGNCTLSVSDDGRGITQEQSSSSMSLGIIGARERLRPLGGSIEFLKRKPKGTTARLTMPMG